MEILRPREPHEVKPLILQRLGSFVLTHKPEAVTDLPPFMRTAFGVLTQETATQETAEQLDLRPLNEVDRLSLAVARQLWNNMPEAAKDTEEAQELRLAINRAAASYARLPNGQRQVEPLLKSVPKPSDSFRAAWHVESLRRMHHILVDHNLDPQRLLVNNLLCQTAYPYFVGAVHLPKSSRFIRELQDETIAELVRLAPQVLGFAKAPRGEGTGSPYPTAVDPAHLPWRKKERRQVIPFMDQQLTIVGTAPDAVLPADLIELHTRLVTSDISLAGLAQETGKSLGTLADQVARIVDTVVKRVPEEDLQLRRLRTMASYVLLGVAPHPASKSCVKLPTIPPVPADAKWRRGEQLEVVRQLHGLLEARGYIPEQVLGSKTLAALYDAATHTSTAVTEFAVGYQRDRTNINRGLRAVIDKMVALFPPETIALEERRREARAQLQSRFRAGKVQYYQPTS